MDENLGKGGISGNIFQEVTIPAKEYLGLTVKKGQILRIIDLEGQQVADVIFFNMNNPEERSSCICTTVVNDTWRITKGHWIASQKANKMLTIVEDKVGMHHFFGGYCNDDRNYYWYKMRGTRNCRDNLTMAIAPYGLTGKDFNEDCCASLFMNLIPEPNGDFKIREPLSKPGDYIDLKAEMDIIGAISNCPQDRNPCNAFNPTPIKVIVYKNP